jgi:hypothetical protein
MPSTFQSSLWQISVPPPWKAEECEDCVEFTQPDGAGALHISGALKQAGQVLDTETREQMARESPEDAKVESVRLGDFSGYGTDYVDWQDSIFWRKWFVCSGRVLLFITYNCKRGDEELELPQVSRILSSLRCRDDAA